MALLAGYVLVLHPARKCGYRSHRSARAPAVTRPPRRPIPAGCSGFALPTSDSSLPTRGCRFGRSGRRWLLRRSPPARTAGPPAPGGDYPSEARGRRHRSRRPARTGRPAGSSCLVRAGQPPCGPRRNRTVGSFRCGVRRAPRPGLARTAQAIARDEGGRPVCEPGIPHRSRLAAAPRAPPPPPPVAT